MVTNNMETKQTAVEWLTEQLQKHYININIKDTVAFDQAKAMEKEQHSDTWNHGSYSLLDHGSGEDFEQYYNETYGKE